MQNKSTASSGLFFTLITGFIISFLTLSTIPSSYAKTRANTNSPSAEKSDVVILTASWCHYCTKMRQYLTSNKVKFTEYDIEKSNLGYQLYRSLGGKGVPVVKVGETVLYGYNSEKLKQVLNESGYQLP